MNESLRILLVTLDYPPPPGGIQTIVKNLEQGLAYLGHKPKVVHLETGDIEYSKTDFLPRPRWLYNVETVMNRDFIRLNAVYRKTNTAINQFDPDVVHVMHIKHWPALIAAKELDIPSALSTYALELGNESLAAQAIRDADVVHALTQFTASLVQSVSDGNPTIDIIPPSIDVDKYRAAVENHDKSSRNFIANAEATPVVSMSRLVDRKNTKTVIKAWMQLDESVRDGRELIVAGDGPNRTELEALAEDCADVRLIGWVTGAKKRHLLAEADAFVMVPWRDGYDVEGFGIVYIESQASATPVVGSKYGGAAEAIGDAGIVVESVRDTSEVATSIKKVLSDKTVRQHCISSATERIDKFDLEPIARRHVAMYEGI
jgi:phosphatidylinositol alpha-1,6-mannosyltransferase